MYTHVSSLKKVSKRVSLLLKELCLSKSRLSDALGESCNVSDGRVIAEESWRDRRRVLSFRFTHGCIHNRESAGVAGHYRFPDPHLHCH